MKLGIYRDIPNEEYQTDPALGSHDIGNVLRSPAHFKYAEEKDSEAYTFGSAYHVYCLQNTLFDKRFVIKPEGMKFSTKEGKAWKAEIGDKKTILSYDDFGKLKAMYNALMKCDDAATLLKSDGEAEVSIFWNDPEYGVPCKARLDWLNKSDRIIADLKSCLDAREHQFETAAYRYGYHIQAAHYLYGISQVSRIEHTEFRFIAQEKDAPYAVQVFRADEGMVQEGLIEMNKALALYAECEKAGTWPAYPMGVKSLSLPGWVKKKNYNLFLEGDTYD